MELSKLQKDALIEILNIAIGRAASSLSQMVRDEIFLTIPEISFLKHSEILDEFKKRNISSVNAVNQKFEGQLSGNSLLLFPESDGLKLVQCVLGEMVDDDSMTELEQETVTEVGNVVLNASLGSLSDQLHLNIKSTLPKYLSGHLTHLLEDTDGYDASGVVMLVEVSFDIRNKEVCGYLLLMFNLQHVQIFLDRIDEFIQNVSDK